MNRFVCFGAILILLSSLLYAQVTNDGNLNTTVAYSAPTYNITNGTNNNPNLFHGFSAFTPLDNSNIRFNNSAAYSYIIGRVVTGAQFTINNPTSGNINLTNNAGHLILIAPDGINFNATSGDVLANNITSATFGAVYRVNLTTSGSYLGASFAGDQNLDNSAPLYLGSETGSNNGAVTITNSTLNVTGNLTFVGSSITASGTSKLAGNRIYLAADQEAYVDITSGDFSDPDTVPTGDISATDTVFTLTGSDRALVVRGNNLSFNNGDVTSKDVDLGYTNTVTLSGVTDISITNDSRINLINTSVAGGTGGSIIITNPLTTSPTINIDNSQLDTYSSTAGGTGGEVVIGNEDSLPTSVTMGNTASIRTYSNDGTGGEVTINAGSLNMTGDSIINARTQTGTGGNVNLNITGDVSLDNSAINTNSTSGLSGNVTIDAGSLNMTAGSQILANTQTGTAGTIDINVTGAITIDNNSVIHAISDHDTDIGTGGTINIDASDITLDNGFIRAYAAYGDSGSVNIDADNLTMTNGSRINAHTEYGEAGEVNINLSGTLSLSGDSGIRTQANNSGPAGNINIDASDVTLDNSHLWAFSHDEDGGSIDIETDNLTLDNNSEIDADGVTAGGSIHIDVLDQLRILNNSLITSTGPGGGLEIHSHDGLIDSSTISTDNLSLYGYMRATGIVSMNATTEFDLYGSLRSGDGLTINSPLIFIQHGGELRSSGLINGDIRNSGRIAPHNFETGNNIATLRITGNYEQSQDGTLEVDVTPAANDVLQVGGNVNIHGGAIDIQHSGKFKTGDKYTIVTAGGNVNGKFDRLENARISCAQFFDVRFLPQEIQLIVKRNLGGFHSDDPRIIPLIASLDKMGDDTPKDLEKVLRELDYMDNDEAERALSQLHSEPLDAFKFVRFKDTGMFVDSMIGHVNGLREVREKAKEMGFYPGSRSLLAYCGFTKDPGPESSDQGMGLDVFGRLYSGYGDQEDVRHERTGFEYFSIGFLTGADYAINKELSVGVHVGYSNIDINFYDIGRSEGSMDNIYVGVNANLYIENFSAHAIFGYTHSFFENERHIVFGDIDRIADAQFDGDSFYATLNLGYEFRPGNWRFGPIVSVDYIYQHIDDIRESSAGDLNLVVDDRSANSLRTSLGARFAYNIELGSDINLVPEIRGLWMHEFLDERDNLHTYLVGNPNNPFRVPTADCKRDQFRGSAGVSLFIKKFMSISAEYTVEAQQYFIYHGGNFAMEFKF